MLTLNSHLEFLSRYFSCPNPDRTEPYTPAGVRDARSCFEGFPQAALVDRKFTSLADQKTARLELMAAYHARETHMGWFSYDIKTCAKKPVTSEAKCGYKQGFCLDRDFLVSTYESMQILEPARRPTLLAYHTNSATTPFAIDLDFREGEEDAVRTFFIFLEKNGIDPRPLCAILTPRLGVHLCFLPYFGPHKTAANVAPEIWGAGVDVRGTGGVTIAPGSFYSEGEDFRQYMVLNNAPLQPLPACVAEVLAQGKRKPAVAVPADLNVSFDSASEIDAACRILASTAEGGRNDTLNKMSFAAGKLIRDNRLSEEEAREKLTAAAEICGLEHGEIGPTLDSGLKGGMESSEPYTSFNNENESPNSLSLASILGMKPEQSDEPCPREPVPEEVERREAEAFIREKRQADRSYRPGRLTKFAERRGELTDERVDKTAKFVLPKRFYEVVKSIAKAEALDLTCVVQAASCIANFCLRGSRALKMYETRDEVMMPMLFLHLNGTPRAGKSRLCKHFIKPISKRQARETKDYEKERKEYEEAMSRYRRLTPKQQAEEEPPREPEPYKFFTVDATIEAALENARYCPEGEMWFKDEGAGQGNMGGDVYNKAAASQTRSHLIAGYNGDSVMVDRKKHNGKDNSFCVDPFSLCIWTNIQPYMLPMTFGATDVGQGYLQRFLHIIMPSPPEGDSPTPYMDNEHCTEKVDQAYLESVLNRLLDLRLVDDGEDLVMPILHWSDGAKAVYSQWHHAFAKCCQYGSLVQYFGRFEEQILRIAIGLHYLHLAVKSVDTGKSMIELEGLGSEQKQYLEKEDVERAVAVADLFMKSLDKFLWLLKKPTTVGMEYLTPEQEAFAKHVHANTEFYREPRSVREILGCGYQTDRTQRDLFHWLKKQGFPIATKQENNRRHREVKFNLEALQPWSDAIDLGRLVFSENPHAPVAKAIVENWELIESSDLRLPVDEFAYLLDWGEESISMINEMVQNGKIPLSQDNGMLIFKEESLEIAKRILLEEGEAPAPQMR